MDIVGHRVQQQQQCVIGSAPERCAAKWADADAQCTLSRLVNAAKRLQRELDHLPYTVQRSSLPLMSP